MLREQVEKASNPLLKEIGEYLLKRAGTDPSVAKSIEKENKSLEECFDYIIGEMQKRAFSRNGGRVACGPDNQELYNLAIHYYDEDEIKIESLPSGMQAQVSTSTSLTSLAVERKKEKPITAHKKKNNVLDGQIALF